MQQFKTILSGYLSQLHIPVIRWTDILEILIIAFLIYHIMIWLKNTRTWALLKGVLVIFAFIVVAALLNMTTILWIVKNVTGLAVIAIVVILQPELRHALEELGRRSFMPDFFNFSSATENGLFSDNTINEIVRACGSMAKVKTGALIVIEQNTSLREYERTGINIDAIVSSQLLINIFEKNTPLHDGAVVIHGDRVTAATCYLPLSESKIDKNFGTRHRAGLGISEVTDSLTIIVSEETGAISLAYKGVLERSVDTAWLKERLIDLQNKESAQQNKKSLFAIFTDSKERQ